MTIIKNTYTGDGSTVIYSFTFPYLRQEHVKATINGTPTTLFTFANATTLQFNTPPPNGAAVVIFRETESDELDNRFFPNSSIRAGALNSNFTQGLYVAQETQGEAGEATATANQALGDAASAIITANSAASDASAAVITANAADSAASSAVSTAGSAVVTANAAVVTANNATNTANSAVITANAASSAASGAVSTANSAVSTANAAVLTANAADSNASAAVLTANAADSNASAAVITANTADSNATAAIGIANGAVITANDADNTANNAESVANFAITTALAAQAAVAAVVIGTPVNDVAALLLLSPSDGDVFEIIDSTGVESEPSITSVPGGFVGDSGLAVSVIFVAATTEFEFISYRPTDPDARYAEVATEGIAASAQSDASNALGQLVNAVFDSDVRLTDERVPTNDSVTDAKVSSTAAIAGTKISPNFGSQAVSTTGGFTGSLTGNASTATTLQTARTINGVSFDGGTNITVTANTPNSVTPGSFLLGSSFNGSAARTFSVDAVSTNTASKIVSRDASGNFSAGTITANLTGTASAIADNTVTSAKIVDGAIVDADINNSAAIAGTKISPDFGSQNVVTTGTAAAANILYNRRPAIHRGPLFFKTSATAISVVAGSVLNGRLYASATTVTMPSHTNNTDYAIWQHPSTGDLVGDASFSTAPTGAAGGSIVGGYHYIPSGRPTAVNNGSPTGAAEILEYSIWDLTWRPTCPDPRGMSCIDGRYWIDLYLCGKTSYAGTDFSAVPSSKIGLTIADNNDPPLIPAFYGGNGSTAYSLSGDLQPGSWMNFAEVAQSFGKRLPEWGEFSAAAFGAPEAGSRGSDPGTVIWERASKWGLAQATGTLWVWGVGTEGNRLTSTTTYSTHTGGRGSLFAGPDGPRAVRLGGGWNTAGNAGSRAADWGPNPWVGGADRSARFAAGHLILG